ncbi:TadE/TadG family type IV pilus assembly protein [Vibrio breoganii]
MKSYKGQKGVAIIVVALSMVAIGGMAQLAIEGGRMIQERDRLADASEAAILAVSIADREDSDFSNALARKYLENYLSNTDVGNVNVSRKNGDEQVDGNTYYYVQYELDADVTFDKQLGFINNSNSSGSEQYKVNNDAMARTYMLPTNLDLVFVADFSGSMANEDWGDYQKRIDVLKEQVEIITEDLLSSEAIASGYEHRVGFVPYNMRTQESISGQRRCVTELEYTTVDVNTGYYTYEKKKENDKRGEWVWNPGTNETIAYDAINWADWGKQSESEREACADNPNDCNNGSMNRIGALAIGEIFDSASNGDYPDAYDYVDFSSTIENWRQTKTANSMLHPISSTNGTKLFSAGMCAYGEDFYTIPLTNQISVIEEVQDMEAAGWTSVYQGLLRGAQILADGEPDETNQEAIEDYYERAQMILILSDGQERPFENTFSELVAPGGNKNIGLCSEIRDHFINHESQLYIGVIGIDFNAQGQTGFQDCVIDPDEDIIDVSNSEDLLEKIRELIRKGAATNGVSRLYDKNS